MSTQLSMTDVPTSVFIVSTITPAVAGLAPVIFQWVQNSRRENRDRAERKAKEELQFKQDRQAECVKLIEAARNFRVLVENGSDPQGTSYLLPIRKSAAELAIQADVTGFKVPATETAASALADEARTLAAYVGNPRNWTASGMINPPDYAAFDEHLADFKKRAPAAIGDLSPVAPGGTALASGAVAPALDAAANGQGQR